MKLARLRDLAGFCLLTLVSCSEGTTPSGPDLASSITLNPSVDTLLVLQSLQLVATAYDTNGDSLPSRSISWTSSDPTIATVDGDGLVEGKKGGIVSIRAEVDTVSATASLTVLAPVHSIVISPSADTIPFGTSLQLTASVLDAAGTPLTGQAVQWSIADTTRATVDSAGLVTVKAPGIFQFVAFAGQKTGVATVSSFASYQSLAADFHHTCGVDRDGKVLCWGLNRALALGRISACDPGCELPYPISANGQPFSQVTTGEMFACGLLTSGNAMCWGFDGYGQLGRGSWGVDSAMAQPVVGGISFSTISAGGEHVCGLATSSNNGNVWCWGSSRFGQASVIPPNQCATLYSSPCTGSPTPANIDLVQISSGTYHTCGVTAAGVAYCWGSNLFGELGAGPIGASCYGIGGISCSPIPLPVSGNLIFRTVSAGNLHTCGVTTDNLVYCWGWNDFGQLGTANQVSSDVPVRVNTLPNMGQVTVGDGHSCALTLSGQAYCWGSNQYGELGVVPNGESCVIQGSPNPCRTVATPLGGNLTFNSLSLGIGVTCGLDSTGLGYCWGLNVYGQLGSQIFYQSTVPVRIHGQQ